MDATLRIFCFPFAGGGPSLFRNWQASVPDGVQICPIALPGREKRLAEQPIDSMRELTDILQVLLNPYTHRPFVLFGHCFGGCLAFELARKLQDSGVPPSLLAVSGCRAPHLPPPVRIAHLPHADFVEALRRFKLTPETVLDIPDLLALFLPALRADLSLDEGCLHTGARPLFAFPLAVMYGASDAIIPEQDILPWQDYSGAGCAVTRFAGEHVFFVDDPAPMLRALLDAIPASALK
jgi:surfactin synthase thioesterase subunit